VPGPERNSGHEKEGDSAIGFARLAWLWPIGRSDGFRMPSSSRLPVSSSFHCRVILGHRDAGPRQIFRGRLLESHSVHDADGDHHHRRLRSGHLSASSQINSLAREHPAHASCGHRLRCVFLDGDGDDQLGPQSDFQRSPGAGIVRNVRGIDYRAVGAAAYLGTGSVWALGLSSSAALVMATQRQFLRAVKISV